MAKTTKPKETDIKGKELIIKLHDFEIYTDSIYEVQPKKDYGAPDGFIKENTTKLLNFKIQDSLNLALVCPKTDLWDTGLTENSTALKKAFTDPDVRKLVLKNLEKHIVTPYKDMYGEDKLGTIVNEENNEFWDNLRAKVYSGRYFNTNNLNDLLELYLLLLHKKLTPSDKESHRDFKQPKSSYLIINKEAAVSVKIKNTITKFSVIAKLHNLLENNLEQAKLVLDYAGIMTNSSSDSGVIMTHFENLITDDTHGSTTMARFLEAVEMLSDNKGSQILDVFKKLKELNKLNNGTVKQRAGTIYLKDRELAKGFKNSANVVFMDKDLLTDLYS